MPGEITQEAINLALGSAGLAATGAVAAQIVAAVFTGKREKKKAEAEERRWQIESDVKRRDRNLDHKLDLFARFLSTAESVYQDMAWGTQITDDEFHEYQPRLQQLRELSEEIGIIAPETYKHTNHVLTLIGRMLKIKTPFLSPPIKTRADQEAIEEAEQRVTRMIRLTRAAFRSYVSHQPLDWPEKDLKELGLL
ncbi:hypothetical protein [Arthrobacter sp. B1I2]|uniref:hypothetical protein n=1 Tax=Arthrobacter sp. B1I2 TaxID=3042263 RepID=UPI00278387EB|nr:hypothetical protein [Arthrobacter sp. B1I2]MDQ0730444.1 hypothetical protein [Arthrobacter sp. B1I2]